MYGDRVNELDLRLAKNIRIGRVRTNVGVDIYNVFNSAPVLTYNQAFVPASATSAGSWLAADITCALRGTSTSIFSDVPTNCYAPAGS